MPAVGWLFFVAAGGAAITAFYMFRLWFLTFAGEPRDEHIYAHAHESPRVMTIPLVILAVMAVIAGWTIPGIQLGLPTLLDEPDRWPLAFDRTVLFKSCGSALWDLSAARVLARPPD